ncbi:MAG TPA: HEAT repeat domain-containing protein [Thermodesulfobacteriota bacterium]|nr:HEAT repeat domain-containing protein [Thermodesulfobacteriota bacterium]
MAVDNVNVDTILIELYKAVKMHNFYPEGHPHFESALDRSFNVLKGFIDENGELKLNIDQKGFYLNKEPLAQGFEELKSMATKLFLRRVKEMTITWRVTKEEIKAFIQLFGLEPEELLQKGGVEDFFLEKDVVGILLNEMRYEDLKKLKRELEEKKKEEEEEKKGAEGEEELEELSMGDAEAVDKARGEVGPEEEEELSSLLERLKTERDLLRYNDISVRVRERLDPLLITRAFVGAFPAVTLFLDHSQASSGLGSDLRSIASEQLDSLLVKEDLIRYLIGRAGAKEEPERKTVQRLILRCGEGAIEILLEILVDAPDASTRRNIFDTAVMFGKKLFPHLEKRIQSPKWYEVRQMVALLGELGDPAHIDKLEEAYGNEDTRVKREVLRSLARIPSSSSTAFLLKALEEEEASLMTQAIVSLGMLRDPAAIESIGEIALKWEPFADNHEPKKEAIKALGIIGDRRAVGCLTKILLKKAWFGKRAYGECRSLAANSLGMIGGEEAYGAIEEVCGSSEGELYKTCKRILEGREKRA